LGLANDVFVGVPPAKQRRCADTYGPEPRDNSAEFKAAGMPSGGGYATARGMAAFYQMLLGKGRLGDVRLLSPRLVAYVTRNHTGDRGDDAMGGIPMHRGLGPHVRGDSERIRGLGTLAAPEAFGHGGAGTSYSWADPTSGVSFSYLTNGVQPDPWHSARLDRVSNLVHAAID
jgi:CubicO group peptidase (beta-lactamase class C family)